MADLKDYVQIMTLTAKLRTIKTDRLRLIIAAAAAVTAAAVGITQRHAVIANKIIRTFCHFVIPQLITCILISKTKAPALANLTAADPEPGAFGSIAVVAQFSHSLQQLIILRAPGMVIQSIG